jgi:antitoxin (DNA-binding transcriptional repressor) of toxin-antitoxin stability system
MSTLTISEARATLPDVVDRVSRGEEITITRHGQPVAVVVRPDVLRARRVAELYAEGEWLREIWEEAGRLSLADTTPLTAERAEELIAEIRAGRDAR